MAAKTFLRHLVTSQENHQSWKQIIEDWKMMPTKIFCSSNKLSHLVLYQSTWNFLASRCTQNWLTSQQTPSTKTQVEQHDRHNIVIRKSSTLVETHLKHQPSQYDKSTYMIHNHVTIMNHSWWTITRFTAYTYTKTNACAWLFNSSSSTNIST